MQSQCTDSCRGADLTDEVGRQCDWVDRGVSSSPKVITRSHSELPFCTVGLSDAHRERWKVLRKGKL